MTTLTIEQLGATVLRQPARSVDDVDDELRALVRRMFETMYAANGQGLAAPQIGIALRLAVVAAPLRHGPSYVLINPRLVAASDTRVRGIEGCLSIPGVAEFVDRPDAVTVEAQDLGGTLRLEAEGELARCLQHEIDHLDGLLYIDRLSPLARSMLVRRYRKRHRTLAAHEPGVREEPQRG
jgi:peptide deformylase